MPHNVKNRIREIREARGEKQPEFAAVLNNAAKRLSIDMTYNNTTVSKMETGARSVTLEDVMIIASVDPLGRPREWLAWGEASASVRRRGFKAL